MKCPVCEKNIQARPVTEPHTVVVGHRMVRIALHGDCRGSGVTMLRKTMVRKKQN